MRGTRVKTTIKLDPPCGICQEPLEQGPSGNWLDRRRQMMSSTPYFHYHLTYDDMDRRNLWMGEG